MERSCERIPLLRFDGGISILRTIALASRIPKLAMLVSKFTRSANARQLCLEPQAPYIKKTQKVYLETLEIEHYSLKFAKNCGFHLLAPRYHRQRINVIDASSHALSCIHIHFNMFR